MNFTKIIGILAAMAFSIAILFGSTACKSGIKIPGLGRPPTEPGVYIDVGHGWQQVDKSKLQWSSKSYAPTSEELESQAFTIGSGKKTIELAYVMTPTEAADPSTLFLTNMSNAVLYPLKQAEMGDQSPKISEWVRGEEIPAKELSSSKPKEGYQCFEFTLPTASAFVISSFKGHIYLKF